MEAAREEANTQRQRDELLILAANHGFKEDVNRLLSEGADPCARDKQGISAIHFAAGKGQQAVVQLLVSRGVDIDLEDPTGRTPIHYAASSGHADVIKTLIKKGAWLDAYDQGDDTALHIALRRNSLSIAKQLLMGGAKTHIRNSRGLTALGEALTAGNMEAAKLLIDNNADVMEKQGGYSLLHLAAGLGNEACLRLLLQHVKPKDVPSPGGVTPLHSATVSNCAAAVQLLLESGADPQATDDDNKTAMDWAKEAGAETVVGLLGKGTPKREKRATSGAGARMQPMDLEDEQIGVFARLPREEQFAQIERWAESPKTALKKLNRLDDDIKKAIGEVGHFMRKLNCHRAMNRLRNDEDFQEDVGCAEVVAAVEEASKDPKSVEKYTSNEKVMGVLNKLRQLQVVLRQNGKSKIIFDELVSSEDNDLGNIEQSLEESLKSAKQAVIDAVLKQKMKEAKQDQALSTSGADERVFDFGGKSTKKGLATAAMALPKGSMWKALGQEFVRQLFITLVVFVVIYVTLSLTNNLPWQNSKWLEEQLRKESARPAQFIKDPEFHRNMPGSSSKSRGEL